MDESRRIKRKVFLADRRLEKLETGLAQLAREGLDGAQPAAPSAKQEPEPPKDYDLVYDLGPHLDLEVNPQALRN